MAANGEPLVCPREAAIQAVEDEQVRVLKYQEALLERRKLEEVMYDPKFDYSLLSVCKHGEYHINSQKPKNILLISNLQDKVFVSRSRAPADLSMSRGASASARLLSTSKGI